MTKTSARHNNQFVVSFGDVQLPEALARRIEIEIRKTALSILAEADLHPNEHVTIRNPIDWRGIRCEIERPKIFEQIQGNERGNG